jgi:hypothetical protein
LVLLTVYNLFFELLCIFGIVVVLIIFYRKEKTPLFTQCLPFLIASLAASFAMMLTPTPALDRAYFGASIFLIIACLRGMTLLFFPQEEGNTEKKFIAARYLVTALLCLWLFFDYQENLVKLVRIWQEENLRIEMINEAIDHELDVAIVPQRNNEYANRYSFIHVSDVYEDFDHYMNIFYFEKYHIKVFGIPYQEWTEMQAEVP